MVTEGGRRGDKKTGSVMLFRRRTLFYPQFSLRTDLKKEYQFEVYHILCIYI